jgi:DNA-binding MarR family transcriptional regulator
MSTDGLYVDLLMNVHRVDLLSRRVADQQLTRDIGIGRAMFLVLDFLHDTEPSGSSQRAIADTVGLTKAAVSRHVATAERHGWVTARPSPASRRENQITLTTAGRRLVTGGRRRRAAAEAEAVGLLGRAEMERATRTLVRLAKQLEDRLTG